MIVLFHDHGVLDAFPASHAQNKPRAVCVIIAVFVLRPLEQRSTSEA